MTTSTGPTAPNPAVLGAAAPPVAVSDVSKNYKDFPALSNVTFTVRRGSITGLLGHPGSGKSTVLRTIVGLVKPTTGEATVNGVPFTKLPRPAHTVGVVLGGANLHPRRPVLAHLKVHAAAIGVPDSRALQILASHGLSDVADRRSDELSAGQRRRLALATAVLGDPHTLIVDEPTKGLDPSTTTWMHTCLKNHAAAGRTVLLTGTHVHDISNLVDHIVVLVQGHVAFQGRTEDLRRARADRLVVACSAPGVLATSLAARGHVDVRSLADGRIAVGGAPYETVAAAAREAGVILHGVTPDRIDLDHLYEQIASGQFVAGASGVAPAGYGVPPAPHVQSGYVQAQRGYVQPPPGYPGVPRQPANPYHPRPGDHR